MKYLKIIFGLGLIPMGVLLGSFINIGDGSAAVFGGILGGVVCCILFWSFWPHFPGSASLEELYMNNSDREKQAIDDTVRGMRETQINGDLVMRDQLHKF